MEEGKERTTRSRDYDLSYIKNQEKIGRLPRGEHIREAMTPAVVGLSPSGLVGRVATHRLEKHPRIARRRLDDGRFAAPLVGRRPEGPEPTERVDDQDRPGHSRMTVQGDDAKDEEKEKAGAQNSQPLGKNRVHEGLLHHDGIVAGERQEDSRSFKINQGRPSLTTHKKKAILWPQLNIFRDRLMAGQRTLNPLIVVRIHVPEPQKLQSSAGVFVGSPATAGQCSAYYRKNIVGRGSCRNE